MWAWARFEKGYELCGAIMMGILQWFVLRQQVSRAYWWIVITVISWFILSFAIVQPLGQNGVVPVNLLQYVCAVHGLLTGYPLAWLLESTRKQENFSNS